MNPGGEVITIEGVTVDDWSTHGLPYRSTLHQQTLGAQQRHTFALMPAERKAAPRHSTKLTLIVALRDCQQLAEVSSSGRTSWSCSCGTSRGS